ncbi:MAG: 16S rRNA (uracil(1498)-N(3))-methyltransferase [Sulfurospirillaceae bacterium]|nr:16S rRNA (uracil(1498)-N(3))-methyltransferase [Sulfurospirillaceae bacterium]MDD3462204.1 16S rRNA (uracil(1498)-N(3))-methyltransferase [Sulfurospirillaceae bacterium]
MQFVYHEKAGEKSLVVDASEYAHILKVRRTKIGDILSWRNLRNDTIHDYKAVEINKKNATWELVGSKELSTCADKKFVLGWCVVEPKIIEKTLPMFNEMGLSKIVFVYADFSQKQFKIDLERARRILINSSQQCGRSDLLEIEILESVEAYLKKYPKSAVLNFSDNKISQSLHVESLLVGPEGGFSKKELQIMRQKEVFGLDCPLILRSETAAIAICAKVLL